MKYILETILVGPLEVNCYIFGCKKTYEAAIIDPGDEDRKIKKRIKELGLVPKYVINTHGHPDHTGANGKFGLPILIHKLDAPFLGKMSEEISLMVGMLSGSPAASNVLEDADKIDVGELSLEVIHTPGHSRGSISLKYEDIVFTGDTLFNQGVGRTDLPMGSWDDLINSLRKRLLVLPDETKIYPGHGPASTIGYEKLHNPFV